MTGSLDNNLGALLVGVFLNTYLYGLASFQYASYAASDFNDKLCVRSTVFFLFLLDTAHSASVIYMVWEYGVRNFNRPLALLSSSWPYPFTVIVTVCTAYLVQIFFTHKIWKLTHSRGVSGFIFALVTCTFGLGIATSVKAWNTKLFIDFMAFRPLLATWLSMEVLADGIIAGILLYKLWISKKELKNSDHIIHRLMRISVQTGACAGLFAVLSLAFFFSNPRAHIFAIFGIPISRVYTNTFMNALLARHSLRELLFNKTDTSDMRARGGRTMSTNTIQLHVRKEVYTVVDETNSIHRAPDLKSPRLSV